MALCIERDTYQLVSERLVFTYQPDGLPRGLITAVEDTDGLVLEHVVVFPGAPAGTLLRLVRIGLKHCAEFGFRSVRFGMPDAFPLASGLGRLATRLGFEVYLREDGWTWWVRWR